MLRAAFLVLALLAAAAPAAASPFGDAFWSHWGDGRAEMNGYDLSFPRYGQVRPGTAVAIFVTETFRHDQRVKTDRPEAVDAPTYPVMKLNLVEDFATGVYDYNLMTSVFVALQGGADRPVGWPVKVSFSSQEWCGQVWWQALFLPGRVRLDSHSYFEDEADRRTELPTPQPVGSEDQLFLWARGLAAPFLEPGATARAALLSDARRSRLEHTDEKVETVELARAVREEEIEVPAGTFAARVHTARLEDGGSWTFWTETAPPHRLLRWEDPRGAVAELRASTRMAYWKHNDPAGLRRLEDLGLSPRPPHTP